MGQQYIVLMEISPDQGQLIRPAAEGDVPTVVDEDTLFAGASEFLSNEERARILINKGVIVRIEDADLTAEAKRKLKQTQTEAEKSLKQIT